MEDVEETLPPNHIVTGMYEMVLEDGIAFKLIYDAVVAKDKTNKIMPSYEKFIGDMASIGLSHVIRNKLQTTLKK